MSAIGTVLVTVVAVYVGVCIGRIAGRQGRNPWLFGILGTISPINLVLLGILAFGNSTRPREEDSPVQESGTRETGSVKWYNQKKGYGFILRESGEEIFVHQTAISGSGLKRLEKGANVEFAVVQKEKGPTAVKVQKLP